MLEEAMKLLLDHAGIHTDKNDFSYEALIQAAEDLDPTIVPDADKLPKTVMTHVYLYVDQEEKEYMVYFITDLMSKTVYSKALVIDSKVIWSKGETF